jgi:cell division septal protein FtsQ
LARGEVEAMARLTSLAAVRAQPFRPALRRPLLRLRLRRIVLAALAGFAALVLGYVVARETPLFAVDELEISGAPVEVQREVKAALEELTGTSLVEVDAAEVERELRGLSSVHDARVDRSFPHTLRIVVVPEEPLVLVWDGRYSWVVSRRGRVIRAVEPGRRPRLPQIWSTEAATLSPGERVTDPSALVAQAALAAVPPDFPVRIRAARSGEDGLLFVLAAETELRLGTNDDLDAKLEAAAAVLDTMSRSERLELAYLDVSLAQRPVGLAKSQVSSDG